MQRLWPLLLQPTHQVPNLRCCHSFARCQVLPVHDDILIAKLRPGQAIELECHCIKGAWHAGRACAASALGRAAGCGGPGSRLRIGWGVPGTSPPAASRTTPCVRAGVGDEHAKWSPVATTWYRLMPEVVLLQQPRGTVAQQLAAELPGLLSLQGSGDKATLVVGDVRQHDKLLEKVGGRGVLPARVERAVQCRRLCRHADASLRLRCAEPQPCCRYQLRLPFPAALPALRARCAGAAAVGRGAVCAVHPAAQGAGKLGASWGVHLGVG